MTPPPGHDHFATSEPFRDHLVAYKLAHPEVIEFVFQESWTAIGEDTDRRPDIAVYLKSDLKAGQQIPGRVPELVIEIVSAGWTNRKRDYDEKRDDYEGVGVQEYVIVDRFDERVTVLRVVDGAFQETTLKASDDYTTPLLPGLKIPLQPIIG